MRPRLLVAVALGAALLGAGGVRAAPAAVSLAPVAPSFTAGVPVQTLASYGVRGMHVVGYEHGASTRMTLTLHNTGRLPMTVTSVRMPGGIAPLLTMEDVQGLPLQLAPGERGEVVATAALGNCRFSHERESETHDGVRVGFRVLGAAAVREVPFDRPLVVRSPMITGCPDRLLDRQAADRSDLVHAS